MNRLDRETRSSVFRIHGLGTSHYEDVVRSDTPRKYVLGLMIFTMSRLVLHTYLFTRISFFYTLYSKTPAFVLLNGIFYLLVHLRPKEKSSHTVQSPRTSKAPRRQALGQRPKTVVRPRLVRRQRDRHVAPQPKHVVKVKVAPRRRGYAVDRHVRDVCGRRGRDDPLHGPPVEADHVDGRRGAQVGVVDGVLGGEGR